MYAFVPSEFDWPAASMGHMRMSNPWACGSQARSSACTPYQCHPMRSRVVPAPAAARPSLHGRIRMLQGEGFVKVHIDLPSFSSDDVM